MHDCCCGNPYALDIFYIVFFSPKSLPFHLFSPLLTLKQLNKKRWLSPVDDPDSLYYSGVLTINLFGRETLSPVPNGSAIFKGAKSLLLVSTFCFKTQPVLELQDPNEGI